MAEHLAAGETSALAESEPALVDNMIAAINVNGITGNKPGGIMSQECRCGADVFDAHQAVRRRFALRPFK
jgi:hypothetical protein